MPIWLKKVEHYIISKMANENLTLGNIEIGKKKFYRYKSPVLLRDVEIEKVLVSNKISFGEKNYKYFIGYLYNDNRVKLLHIIFPKTSGYVKSYDGQTKWMYFLIEDDKLLEKHNTIWDTVSAHIKREFDSDPFYKKNFLNIKIKSHGDEVPDFYDNNIPKVDSNYYFFSSN